MRPCFGVLYATDIHVNLVSEVYHVLTVLTPRFSILLGLKATMILDPDIVITLATYKCYWILAKTLPLALNRSALI